MLPSRRKEMAQWIGGVTLTVAAILALAFWLEGDLGNARLKHDNHAETTAQPRVPASSEASH